MNTLFTTISEWFFSRAPAFLVRRYWTEQRLQKYVMLDVRPRGDSLQFCGDNPPRIDLYLRIWNAAPFPVAIDRIAVEVWCNGKMGDELQNIKRFHVQPLESKDVLVSGANGINFEQHFSTNDRIPVATLPLLYAHVQSSVRSFDIRMKDQSYVRPWPCNLSNELRKKFV